MVLPNSQCINGQSVQIIILWDNETNHLLFELCVLYDSNVNECLLTPANALHNDSAGTEYSVTS